MKAGRRIGRKRGKRPKAAPVLDNSMDGFTTKELELRAKFPSLDGDMIASRVAEERRKSENGLMPDLDKLEDELRTLSKPRHDYHSGKRIPK